MNTKYIIICIFLIFSSLLSAQLPDDCMGDRYKTSIYPLTDLKQTTITFGENVTPAGDSIDLDMIIVHNPEDDAFDKPALILAFGGGFVQGNKESMLIYAAEYASRGFIVSVIDYRLWDIGRLGSPSEYNLKNTAAMAVSDMKASIKMMRFLADNQPEFNIDGDRILIGGVSAGAITAMHAAYVDETELDSEIGDLINDNGGIEGNSYFTFTESYSSEVSGVVNFSGGLFDTLLLDAGEPPLISFHGDADAVVPFAEGKAVGLVSMFGSSSVHSRAVNEGVYSLFIPVAGGGHSDIYTSPQFKSERDSLAQAEIRLFLKIFCENQTAISQYYEQLELNLFPNPASDQLTISSEFPITTYQIINMQGKILDEDSFGRQKECTLNIEHLDSGMYILNMKYDEAGIEKATSQKFVKR